ncbi:hypothetical protein PV327_010268 [Microctonus hyperodae]|uniref:Centriolar and ciliogenesis-associated protein HYLS1 C-terminal domain-containing protein n=1 Tax=Microctonus hyperodae TaxID=165561 RepID=A0AA39KUV9_MICHY|nr:hypothetical protein PV327_010268 [Microctonus hyperodae]
MPHGADDPRQVLMILNSLGFVGITAEQLKSFMKDLKLHRKIKESQREQWREETTNKIVLKQRQALSELINPNSNDNSRRDTKADDSAVVKIKIKCVAESDTNDEIENNIKCPRVYQKKNLSSPSRRQEKKEKEISLPVSNKKEQIVDHGKHSETIKKSEITKVIPKRTVSAPELSENISRSRSRSKSATSDATTRRNQSRSSTRSQAKSFIRPWQLHPEIHRLPQNVKSDPVLLYQQYQKGWKQKLLPGENRHAEIRWAVREKMLGTNPTPRPILKKSSSSLSVKKSGRF